MKDLKKSLDNLRKAIQANQTSLESYEEQQKKYQLWEEEENKQVKKGKKKQE